MKNIGQYLYTLLTKSCGHNGMTALPLLHALCLQIISLQIIFFSLGLLIYKLLYNRLFQGCKMSVL